MEVLTPETAKTVELPSFRHTTARDQVIRKHLENLGMIVHPRGRFVFRRELVSGVNAYYTHLAAPSLRVEVLTDFVKDEPSPLPEQTIIEQGEQTNG